ncbi:MAG TPA: GAF domain-containing protein [Anaerolineae bacterium]|nr:GAF domain-containing protein [Anaerolineae bacterium]
MSQLPKLPQSNKPFTATGGIGRTLLLSFLILTLVPLTLVLVIGTNISFQTAQADAFARLSGVSEIKVQAIEDWLGERQNNLLDILGIAGTPQLLQDILRNPNNNTAAAALATNLSDEVREHQVFARFIVLDAAGHSLISTDPGLVGQSYSSETYFTRGLLGPFITSAQNDMTGRYDTIVVAAPVVNAAKQTVGVLVAEANIDQLSRIVLTSLGTNRTDDSYLVGPDRRFLTQSHYLHTENSGDIVETEAVIAALNDPAAIGQATYNNYINQPVLGVYRTIPALHVVLITEQLTADAFAGVQQQVLLGRGAGLLAALVAGIGAYVVTRRIARPIANLTQTATRIAGGDLNQTAAIERHDEFGVLAQTFNSMTAQMRTLIGTLELRVSARTAQLKASADVGRAATSILDSDQLLRQVVNLITDRFHFYYAAVFTLDDAGHYALLREATGEAGRTLKQVGHKLEVGGQSMVGATIKTRTLRIALDVGHEAVRFANPLLPYTRSEIALPLLVGDRVLGALDVQSEQSAAFDEASAEVLQSMADQIAIALLNAESFIRSERQTRTLELLNRLSRELATATSLESISRATAQAVIDLIGPSRLFVALRGNNPDHLAVQEFLPNPEQSLGAVQLVPRANTIIGQTIQTNRTFTVPDMERLADQYQDVAMYFSLGIASGVAIPMQVGEQTLGVFNVGLAHKNALETDQINQLEQVAAQLAIAIENRELLQRMQSTLTELDTVNRRLIGQAWEQYARASTALSGEWREGQWWQVPEPLANTLPVHGLRIPIHVRGEAIGEFNLTPTGTQSEWTSDDITFAQSLIDQVGQTIENARLFEESERLALRERTINDINSRVRQTIQMDTILETAVNELARSLKATRVFARIGGHAHNLATDGNGEGDDHA